MKNKFNLNCHCDTKGTGAGVAEPCDPVCVGEAFSCDQRERGICDIFYGLLRHYVPRKDVPGRVFKSRAAFTLAEVLITLTIIGVIAAITIPNLMQGYKKHQTEAGIKEAYSITSNLVKIIEAENGRITDTIEQLINTDSENYGSEFVDKYVKQNLKYSKYCPTGMGKSECGVFSESANDTNYVDKLSGGPFGGSVCEVTQMERFVLNNGMHVGFPTHNNYKDGISILFDINGNKGPNKLGHDMFFMDIPKTCDGKIFGGTGMGQSNCLPKKTSCKAGEQYGTECVNPIMLNGWKIPDDYPVKKW